LSAFSAWRCVSTSRLSSSDRRANLVQDTDLATRGVALDLLHTVLATELGLVDALDTGLADRVIG
jgi:hypothetical protein